jgi:folate-binding protein YgfZ
MLPQAVAPQLQYETARQSAILVDRTDRAFLRIYGREPVKMVQGLITNDVLNASDTRAVYAGMLTPKGKLVADLRAYRRGDDVLLEVAAAARQPVLDHLKKYVPPLFARVEDLGDMQSMIGVYGPRAGDFIRNAVELESLPVNEDEIVTSGAIACVRSRYTIEGGYELLLPSGQTSQRTERLIQAGAAQANLDTLEVLRIEAGVPRWGAELDENVIPLEAGLRERMISESKGCYTGQEVIIRILHRGHVNRLLRGALLGALPVPELNTPLLTAEGKNIGRITSACKSPRFQQTIGLCYARRELALPAMVRQGDADVRIVELPFSEQTS